MAAPRKTAAKKKATAKRAPAKKKATARKSTARKTTTKRAPAKKKAAKKKAPARKKAAAKKTTAARRARPSAPLRRRRPPPGRRRRDQEEVHRRGALRPRSAESSASGGSTRPTHSVATRSILRPVAIVGAVRIATWNVNSLKARLPRVEEWLDVRAARRAVPPGDQARRHGVPRHGLPGPRLRERAPRRGPVERRRHPEPRRPRRRRRRLHRRRRARLRRPPALGDLRRRAGGQRVRAQRPRARGRPLPLQAGLARAAARRTSTPTATRRARSRSAATTTSPRPTTTCGIPSAFVGSTHVSEPERKALRRLEDWGLDDTFRRLSAPSRGSTRTGTTGPACSTSTRACAST